LATFTPTEQNYNIFEREFLGVKKALANWRPYLIWTKEPFIIEMDHENLTYWKSLRKLLGRTVRWYEELQDYNFKIVHILGKSNIPADALSRPNGEDVQKDEKQVALILPEAFICVFDADSEGSLESRVVQAQQTHQSAMKKLENDSLTRRVNALLGPHWTDEEGRLVVPPDDDICREIARNWHDHRGAGHLGRDETFRKIQRQYFWPGGRTWIVQYVKGCATCQQNKNVTHKTRAPLYKITVPDNGPPFTQIVMDLITGLPKSRGFDSILTIVDHGCSRGVIFLPCLSTITRPQIA
jgi:hypothetical protein